MPTDDELQERYYINPANLQDKPIIANDDAVGFPIENVVPIPDRTTQEDIEVLQGKSRKDITSVQPSIQSMVCADNSLAMCGIKGIGPYRADWLYHNGGLVFNNNNDIFLSLQDRNKGHPLTDGNYWLQIDAKVAQALNNASCQLTYVATWETTNDANFIKIKPFAADVPPIVVDNQEDEPTIAGKILSTGYVVNVLCATTNPFASYNDNTGGYFNIVFTDINDNITGTGKLRRGDAVAIGANMVSGLLHIAIIDNLLEDNWVFVDSCFGRKTDEETAYNVFSRIQASDPTKPGYVNLRWINGNGSYALPAGGNWVVMVIDASENSDWTYVGTVATVVLAGGSTIGKAGSGAQYELPGSRGSGLYILIFRNT